MPLGDARHEYLGNVVWMYGLRPAGDPWDSDRAGMESLKFFLTEATKAKKNPFLPLTMHCCPLHCGRCVCLSCPAPSWQDFTCVLEAERRRLVLFALTFGGFILRIFWPPKGHARFKAMLGLQITHLFKVRKDRSSIITLSLPS